MDLANDPEKVEVLEVDHQFYMSFNPWKKPDPNIKRVRSFNYKPFSLSINEFDRMLKEPRFDEKEVKRPFWQKLKDKLSAS